MDWSSSNDNRSILCLLSLLEKLCEQQSATHKRRMVNLWPNLTAYQPVSFFFSPFARLFIFPFASFRCGPIKKIALTARKSLCSFANGRSGFPIVAVHPLCQLRKRSRTSLLPAEFFGILISRNCTETFEILRGQI